MLYELHITVAPDTNLEDWTKFCENLGAKPLDIRLYYAGNAEHPRQIMFAATTEGDSLHAAEWMAEWMFAVKNQGFNILRVKMEVPLDKSKKYKRPVYFETHVKALVPDNMLTAVYDAARNEGWAISGNALYDQEDGLNKLYFTKRVDGRGDLYQAAAYFRDSFQTATWTNYCHTVRMESETVVIDTDTQLDKGWA